MIEEKYKYIYPYTMACGGKSLVLFQRIINSEKFRDFFKGDFSQQKVRDYFMGLHNIETLNNTSMAGLSPNLKFLHLAVPYEILEINPDKIYTEISSPFYSLPNPFLNKAISQDNIQKTKELGILENELITGDILIFHGPYISDCCKKQDLEKYADLYAKQAEVA